MATQDSTVSQPSQSDMNATPPSAIDRSKYQSPPPPPSSMTPPPSSQAAAQITASHLIRTPTPTHSHLSSPPPTIKAPPHHTSLQESAPGMYSQDQLSDATSDQLRNMLMETVVAYREARASAAHEKLQYNLLSLETSEQLNRMQVELDMKSKEVEVLQLPQHHQPTPSIFSTPAPSTVALQAPSPSDQATANLRNRCSILEIENYELRQRYEEVKQAMLERDIAWGEENERLRERLRENRRHINMIRRSNELQQVAPFSSSFTTPSAPIATVHDFQASKPRGDDAFSALLLADQVLSQEAATTPSTPTPHQRGRGAFAHHRHTHSLSSLPSTPLHPRSAQPSQRAQQYYATPQRNARSPPIPATAPARGYQASTTHPAARRRESRDSTISASDGEEAAGYSTDDASASEDDGGREPGETPASQEAREMLRKSASFGKSQPSSQRSDAAVKSSGLLQTKLYGSVTKPGKRVASSAADTGKTAKKGRLEEGVGLGIGGWSK